MTGVTGVRTVNVRCGLTRSHDSIMTTGADADDLCVINSTCRYWRPGGWTFFVAEFTGICRVNMGRTFSARDNAVMTGRTVRCERCMVDFRRYPGIYRMTVVAFLRGNNVRGCFSLRDNIVVATRTDANDL